METWLAERLLFLIPFWISLGFHEWAHAASAFLLGDRTAAEQGRLTLNPLAHLDWVGTVLFPAIGVPFGWAKPVPVEPTRFFPSISMRTGIVLTALAGPMANLALAAALHGVTRLGEGAMAPRVMALIDQAMLMNVGLAVFNLLPVPPLDGGRVVDGLVPFERRKLWDSLSRALFWVFAALMALGFWVRASS